MGVAVEDLFLSLSLPRIAADLQERIANDVFDEAVAFTTYGAFQLNARHTLRQKTDVIFSSSGSSEDIEMARITSIFIFNPSFLQSLNLTPAQARTLGDIVFASGHKFVSTIPPEIDPVMKCSKKELSLRVSVLLMEHVLHVANVQHACDERCVLEKRGVVRTVERQKVNSEKRTAQRELRAIPTHA